MPTSLTSPELHVLQDNITRLRGNVDVPPAASIVIPVNAQGDLGNVLTLLGDITKYAGKHAIEIVLVINNFPPEQAPAEVADYSALGLKVVSIPNVRRPGEAVGFTARIPGIRAASSEVNILFDSDCRIPNATALIDWYVQQFQQGAKAAYTHVAYYDTQDDVSVRARLWVHHFSRWVKRSILRIPTTRGSNYAVTRSIMLDLYERRMLADEMNVGPAFKAGGHRVVYSGAKKLHVLTSGRMFSGGWIKLFNYLRYRFRYNLRVLPTRENVAQYTQREKDPVRKYVNNKPVD